MTKETLREFRQLAREARQLRDQLSQMESRIYSPKGQQMSKVPRGGNGGRTFDDLAIIHLQLQDKYRAAIADIERQQLDIENALSCLEPPERMVIRYRYIDLLTWEDVCCRMHYSWTQTHRLHGSALRKLEVSSD